MIATVVVVVATHNLAYGVLIGVLLFSSILRQQDRTLYGGSICIG